MAVIRDVSPLVRVRLKVWPGDTLPTCEVLLDSAGATPRRPAYHEFHSDLWIQTLNLGAEWKF